jgi:hypothetical protein
MMSRARWPRFVLFAALLCSVANAAQLPPLAPVKPVTRKSAHSAVR